MPPTQRTARIAGLLYLLTFVSIPTLSLYRGLKTPGYAVGAGPADASSSALLAAFLEIVVALACIGTAVALYPLVRRQSTSLALGFVGARTLEAAMIFSGVASILTLISVRDPAASGATAVALTVQGEALVGHYGFAFLLGQSLMPGINALLLGTLLYRSRLVPRVLPLIGLIGAPIHLTAVLLTFFGVITAISPITLFAALPIALWEFSLGVYLLTRGVRQPAGLEGQPAAP